MKINSVDGDFSKLENILKKLKTKKHVDVGILGNESYEDGATIAGIGAVHEFGKLDGSIPERSFIRMPIETKQKEIEKSLKPKVQEIMERGDIDRALTLLGIACEGAIQEAFDSGGFGTWKDIDQKTKDRKKSDSILIDTSELRKSITSKVGG
jgi:phage gpG-like protein